MKMMLVFLSALMLNRFCPMDFLSTEQSTARLSILQDEYQKDLVLHYTFDKKIRSDADNPETNVAKVLNVAGGRHPGKPNAARFTIEKKSGNCLKIRKDHNKSGYVETADHDDFKTEKFTVAAWIKLEQTNSNGSVVCKHDWHQGGARGFVLRCYDGQRLNFTVGAGGWLAATGKTRLKANKWTHAVGTFDGETIKVYFNGRLDGTKRIEHDYAPSSYPLRIGHAAFSLDTHRKFDGKIDDVMIWKRALNDREILAVYEDQKDSRPPPLVAADIEGLVEQLGSKDFQRRTEAQRLLIDRGTELIPLLNEFQATDDLEIGARLRQIKQAIKNNKWQ